MRTLFIAIISWAVLSATAWTAVGAMPFERGMISISFDDGWRSQHTLGRGLLRATGVPATFYLNITPFDGWSGFMQEPEVMDLMADGHEIGGHTVSHADLALADDASLTYELEYGKDALMATFALDAVPSFASPYGSYDDRVVDAIRRYYASHRTTLPGLNWKDGDVFALKAGDVGYFSSSDLLSMMDAAATGKGWLILVAHELTTGDAATSLDYNVDRLADLIEYAKAAGLEFVTVGEGAARMNNGGGAPAVEPLMIDDFEDLDPFAFSGDEWYGYTDVWGGGNSTLDVWVSSPGTDGSVGALNMNWRLGGGISYPYIGAGVAVSGTLAAGADGIRFSAKGSACLVKVVMITDASRNGYASYQAAVGATGDWRAFSLSWSDFALPSWSPNTESRYPLNPASVATIEFCAPASAGPGDSGLTVIDDLAFADGDAGGDDPGGDDPGAGVLIDDGEDGDGVNALGGYWYTYADSRSTVSPASGSAFLMTPTTGRAYAEGQYGAGMDWTLDPAGYLGMGTALSADGTPLDIRGTGQIAFTAAGGGVYAVVLVMDSDANMNGWASYEASFSVTADFTSFPISWDQFSLPSWSPHSEADYPLDLSRITHIEFIPASSGSGNLLVDSLGVR